MRRRTTALGVWLLTFALGACGTGGDRGPEAASDASEVVAPRDGSDAPGAEADAPCDLDAAPDVSNEAEVVAGSDGNLDVPGAEPPDEGDALEASSPDLGVAEPDEVATDPASPPPDPDDAIDAAFDWNLEIETVSEPDCAVPAIVSVKDGQCGPAGCPDATCLASPDCTMPGTACLHTLGAPLTGVFRTLDAGQSWQPALAWPDAGAATQADATPEGAAYDPSTPGLLFVTTRAGVQRSDDGGDTWTAVLPIACDLVQVHPLTGRVVAVEQTPDGMTLHLSDDHGATWRSSYACLPGHCFQGGTDGQAYTVAFHPVDPDVILLGGLLLGYSGLSNTRSNLVRTADGGTTWQDRRVGSMPDGSYRVMQVAFAPSNPSRVYAAVRTGPGFYVSDDAGVTWVARPKPADYNTSFLAVDPLDANHLWRGHAAWPGGEGLYESIDGGLTWLAYAPAADLGIGEIALGPDGPAWGVRQGGRIGDYDPNLGWNQPDLAYPSQVVWRHDGDAWTLAQCGLPHVVGFDPLYPAIQHLVADPFDAQRATALVVFSSLQVVCD